MKSRYLLILSCDLMLAAYRAVRDAPSARDGSIVRCVQTVTSHCRILNWSLTDGTEMSNRFCEKYACSFSAPSPGSHDARASGIAFTHVELMASMKSLMRAE